MGARPCTIAAWISLALLACSGGGSGDSEGDGGPHGDGDAAPDAGEVGGAGIYGVGIGGDGLANTACGHPSSSDSTAQTMRFRAGRTGALESVRFYYLGSDAGVGYSAGTGGDMRLSIQTDDGTSEHWPSGTTLASEEVPAVATSDAGMLLTFDPAPTLTAGTLYHLVIENVDADPEANYFSPDYWYYAEPTPFGGRSNPKYDDADWAHGLLTSDGWELRPGYAPILDLAYDDGAHEGMGYMELSYDAGEVGTISGADAMVRETITVSGGDRVVTGAGFRVYQTDGDGALTVTLEDGGGELIDSFAVPAEEIPAGASVYGDEARWVSGAFSQPHTLAAGATYHLRLSTELGTTYRAFVIRRGSFYGYAPATYFADGVAEKTEDGTTWSSLGRVDGENDLQVYFAADL